MHVVEPTSQSIVTAIPTPASIPLPSPRPTSSTTHSPAPQAIGITDGAVEGASDSLPSDLRRSEEATKEPTSIEEEEDELASDDGAFSEGTVGSRLSGRSRAPTTPYARGFGSRSSLSTDERRVWKLKWSADEIACLRRIVLASDAPINWEAVASDLARECPPAEGPYRLASGCSQRFVRLSARSFPINRGVRTTDLAQTSPQTQRYNLRCRFLLLAQRITSQALSKIRAHQEGHVGLLPTVMQ